MRQKAVGYGTLRKRGVKQRKAKQALMQSRSHLDERQLRRLQRLITIAS